MEETLEVNKLKKDFKWWSLIGFAIPSILLNLWLGIYQMINSAISSSLINTNALAAIDICYPILSVEEAVAAMLGAGGCAIIGKKLGEGKTKEARSNLTTIVAFAVIFGAVYMAVVVLLKEPILKMLGATDVLMPYCDIYVNVHVFFGIFYLLQCMFQLLLIVGGKPGVGLAMTVVAGVVEIATAYLFIGVFDLGIAGSALGAGCGMAVSAIGSVIALVGKKNELHYGKFSFSLKLIGESCWLGLADMFSGVALGMITALFNIVSIKYYGEDGCAAISILLYSQWLFASGLYGYGKGVGPVLSYNYGEKNVTNLKKYLKISFICEGVLSIVIFLLANGLKGLVVGMYTDAGSNVYKMAIAGVLPFAIQFIVYGMNSVINTTLTSVNDGVRATILAVVRTIVLPIVLLLFLPMVLGGKAIWIINTSAEILSFFLALFLFWNGRKKIFCCEKEDK